eukprot:CAMPEP_0175148754 /NCGR_PEP_ID=MMETSP0087-20121206/16819_1 /TAXON_ID=136419 /ORGANISM="Unknown Unknown, Strain D1" /LENGTH=297 /DNA_ID=CAMNT_0016434281 /DNA_START=58 /DNA_END=948 /DNA_ORIENTATION=-
MKIRRRNANRHDKHKEIRTKLSSCAAEVCNSNKLMTSKFCVLHQEEKREQDEAERKAEMDKVCSDPEFVHELTPQSSDAILKQVEPCLQLLWNSVSTDDATTDPIRTMAETVLDHFAELVMCLDQKQEEEADAKLVRWDEDQISKAFESYTLNMLQSCSDLFKQSIQGLDPDATWEPLLVTQEAAVGAAAGVEELAHRSCVIFSDALNLKATKEEVDEYETFYDYFASSSSSKPLSLSLAAAGAGGGGRNSERSGLGLLSPPPTITGLQLLLGTKQTDKVPAGCRLIRHAADGVRGA